MRLSPRQPLDQSRRNRTVRVGLCPDYRLHVLGKTADFSETKTLKRVALWLSY